MLHFEKYCDKMRQIRQNVTCEGELYVMKVKDFLRAVGEKSAVRSVDLRSHPRLSYQPKPPAKIQDLISREK